MITLKYEPGGEFLAKVTKLNPAEVTILCPVCGAKALFAPDHDTAAKLKMHPGIECPKNWKHLSVTFSLNK
jgi:hypothetical protein